MKFFRKHKKRKIAGIIILLIVLLIGGIYGSIWWKFYGDSVGVVSADKVDPKAKKVKIAKEKRKDKDVYNVLLVGTDSRDPDADRGRSDSMMMVSFNKKEGKSTAISFLRDSLVDIDGHGKSRLGHTYAYGGVGLTINTINIQKRNFTWSTSLNFNLNRNKVVSLGDVSSIPVKVAGGHITEVGRVMVGHPIGSGWGYVFDGIYQQSDFDERGNLKEGVPSFAGITVKPGDMKFKDIAGNDNVIDPNNDKTVIANSDPKHFGGMTNSFTFKNFDLSFMFQWSYGNDIINIGRYRYEGFVGYNNVSTDYWRNRWTEERPGNRYPSLNGEGKTEMSSYYVEDGSYLRLKNLTVGYTLPTHITRKIGLSHLRIYVTAENLFTCTGYSGYDPEVSFWNRLIPGLDYTNYPRARSVFFGVSIKY